MSTLPSVLVTEPLAEDAMRWLEQRARVVALAPSDARFAAVLREAEGLIVRTYTRVDSALLAAAPRLRVVGRAGVGLDNIDLDACAKSGVRVVHTPEANTQAVVEFVLALICDALRPRPILRQAVDAAEWTRLRGEHVGRREIAECTLGVLGFGRIGSRVAEVAKALGMPILFSDLRDILPEERHGAEPVEVEDLFSDADVITIHVDGRAENRGFVSRSLIERMRPTVVFINTSRGFVVDHEGLATFMRSHAAAQALLDVHDPEPVTADNPLLGLSNVQLYPHLASRTNSALARMSAVVREVVDVLRRGT